jgi:hypothetical protein
MRPTCGQISTPSAAHEGRARIENHAAVGEKATARLTLRFIRGGKRCAQSRQFRLSLMNSDSASLTIVLRQSHNGAPKIPEFVPVSPSSTARQSESNEPAKIPTPGLRFCRLSSQSTQTTFPDFQGVAKMSDKGPLSDILFIRQARRIRRGQ